MDTKKWNRKTNQMKPSSKQAKIVTNRRKLTWTLLRSRNETNVNKADIYFKMMKIHTKLIIVSNIKKKPFCGLQRINLHNNEVFPYKIC